MVQAMHMANVGDPVGIMTAIFTQWLREDTDCSWKKLIECMKRCDLTHFAQEMEVALGLAVQGNSGLHVREDHILIPSSIHTFFLGRIIVTHYFLILLN